MPDLKRQPASPFESIRRTGPHGDFWTARELQSVLEYDTWRNFADSIERARVACENSGQDARDHFVPASKTIPLPKGAERDVLDFHLSRYACYLIAMNGDPRKSAIANAQTYFAAQTRAAEVQQARQLAPIDDPVLAQLAVLMDVRRAQLDMEARVETQAQELAGLREELDLSPVLGAQLGTLHRLGQQLGQAMGNYRRAWKMFNDRFDLASYRDLPRCKFDEAVHFLRMQIAAYTGQPMLGGDL